MVKGCSTPVPVTPASLGRSSRFPQSTAAASRLRSTDEQPHPAVVLAPPPVCGAGLSLPGRSNQPAPSCSVLQRFARGIVAFHARSFCSRIPRNQRGCSSDTQQVLRWDDPYVVTTQNPAYPAERCGRLQGRVIIWLAVSAEGDVVEAKVHKVPATNFGHAALTTVVCAGGGKTRCPPCAAACALSPGGSERPPRRKRGPN